MCSGDLLGNRRVLRRDDRSAGERIRDKIAGSKRRARFSEPDPNSKTTGIIKPPTSPAVRYWNMARQRYYRPSARCCRVLRVSADRAARPGPHTREKPRWREMDSNHRYRIRNNPFWLPRSVPQFAFRNKNRLFRAGDRWFESISLQRRDAMGRAARMATSSLHQPMECRDAPAERLEQVPRRPGPK
jgi:hypothetical protein